jgi:crotonobetainyl-CoA:carnitine CoA-transferase CaiB-like acyl-CoA transferase
VLLSCDSLAELAACGYAWETLARRFPRLAHVAIVPVAGEPKGSRSAPPECDLTLSARVGLLEPGPLPRGLFVECAAAERAVTAIVCALYASARGMPPAIAYVALAEAADALAAPLRGGLTGPGTLLGGGFAGYGIYRSADGFVALGACESPYFDRVCEALLRSGTFISFEAAFASQPGAHWERIAGAVGFPLAILYGHN